MPSTDSRPSGFPVSPLLSPEAQAEFLAFSRKPELPWHGEIGEIRKIFDEAMHKPNLARWRSQYPVEIEPRMIGGVQTDVVTPKSGIAPQNQHRVMINLHGGAFRIGARLGGQSESVPVAGRAGIEVITVDYRQGPEHKFPAASEDVAAVYTALLEDHEPQNIGIYGSSAGGWLTAQSIAWFDTERLPRPGAICLICAAGLIGTTGGDSVHVSNRSEGKVPPTPEEILAEASESDYLYGVDFDDPLVSPVACPDVLAVFPPTLLVTATRDFMLSSAVVTHAELLKVGVDSHLYVQEGFSHTSFVDLVGTPEVDAAYDVIWNFFDRHLGTS